MNTSPVLERFQEQVVSKYHIYNSVFITLPFDAIDNTGVLLPLFSEICDKGFENNWSPKQIVDYFAEKYLDTVTEKEKIDLLFRFIQYVERQIVLFDAIEDAAFPVVNAMEGNGSLADLNARIDDKKMREAIAHYLQTFQVRTVLTAHPTQFYPGSVLGIITDLTQAIRENNLMEIKRLLAQLGKTPFIKKQKPTPFDEAVSLIWYLENVFYHTTGNLMQFLHKHFLEEQHTNHPVIALGFWPGGDRDGNPFVTNEITLNVAKRLRTSILKCYYTDIRILKRKLTFEGVDVIIASLEYKLYRSVFYSQGELLLTCNELQTELEKVKQILKERHQSLYLDAVNALLQKVTSFGFYFASLDIRQNAKIHRNVIEDIWNHVSSDKAQKYQNASEQEKILLLEQLQWQESKDSLDACTQETLELIQTIKAIQQLNGEAGCNRYIISNNENAVNVLEVLTLFRLARWEHPTVDIIPLFESVDDLQHAGTVLEQLYQNQEYTQHLQRRRHTQIVMLGFSDGTKDGGYLMANWSIYKAKEQLTDVSRKYGFKVVFFDGRGGPPARGGGKTHKFYASLGNTIESREIQVTVQGQTISSNFGTQDSCRFNLENLVTAGVHNAVLEPHKHALNVADKRLIDTLAELGYQKYTSFKSHPLFVPYLEQMSTLRFYGKTNIGSRPTKRNGEAPLLLEDLRAIPFVGSWSQLKQNVPGFFGVGTALHYFESHGRWEEVQSLYDRSLFFRTLLENSMMSLAKSFFPLTAYMREDPVFGEFWQMIYDEFLETKRLLLKIARHRELMENYPDGKASIDMREKIVEPLLTIQQYALSQLRSGDHPELEAVYEKLVVRSLFGNTNASRNSA